MTNRYLDRPIRALPEALADIKTNLHYDGDADALARSLLTEELLVQYETYVKRKQANKVERAVAA